MKLRYEKRGEGYIPQYQNKKTEEWVDFKLEDLGNEKSRIHQLAQGIADISFPTSYGNQAYYFNDSKSLVFFGEMWVCAFLGAAKVWYTTTTKEFTLD